MIPQKPRATPGKGPAPGTGTSQRRKITIQEIERLLRRLPDVKAVKLVINDRHLIDQIHVITGFSLMPKQVVRNIESALMAKWDIRVDHRRISVAQIAGDDPQFIESRLKLVSVETYSDMETGRFRATVRLADKATVLPATVEQPNTVSGRLRAVAEATLQSAMQFLRTDLQFALDEARPLTVAGVPAVVVLVTPVYPDEVEPPISGAVFVEDESPYVAASRAALDAVNRRFSREQQVGRKPHWSYWRR